MTDARYNKIKMISVCDTIHDFGKDDGLKGNTFYDAFLKDNGGASYPSSGIENFVLENLNIKDIENPVSIEETAEKRADDAKNQLHRNHIFYTIKTNDVSSSYFKIYLGTIVSQYFRDRDITFLADYSLLKREVICNLDIPLRKPYILISEATLYDHPISNETPCMPRKEIPVELTAAEGNLFGLSSISLEGPKNDPHFKYVYALSDNELPEVTTVSISKFTEKQSSLESKYRTFIFDVVESMYKRMNGRNPDTNKPSLPNLLQSIYKVYGLNHKAFKFYIDDKVHNTRLAKKFVNILFDFKRAGDQMQVKSAENSKSIFISNDRVAIAYAYYLGIASIKPSLVHTTSPDVTVSPAATSASSQTSQAPSDTQKKEMKIALYNFDPNEVFSAIKNESYYKALIEDILSRRFPSYNTYIVQLRNELHLDIPIIQGLTDIIKNIILKSIKLLQYDPNESMQQSNMTTRSHTRREEQMNAMTDEDIFIDRNIYIYKYIHSFNIILHTILLNILNHMQSDSLYSSMMNDFIGIYTSIKDTGNVEHFQMLLDKIYSNPYFCMIKILPVDTIDNYVFIYNLIQKYMKIGLYQHLEILYDFNDPFHNTYYTLKPPRANFTWRDYVERNISQINKKLSDPEKVLIYLNSNILQKHNDVIIQTMLEVKVPAIGIFEEYIRLFERLNKEIEDRKLKPESNGMVIDKDIKDLFTEAQIQSLNTITNIRLKLESFMQNTLENTNKKLFYNLQNIYDDFREYRQYFDILWMNSKGEGDMPRFITKYMLNKPRKQQGGSRSISHYSLFTKELDHIYNQSDKVTNDFTKLLVMFIVNRFNIFTSEGNFTHTFANEFSKHYIRKLKKESSKIKSQSVLSTQSDSSALSSADTVRESQNSLRISVNKKKASQSMGNSPSETSRKAKNLQT